MTNHRVYGEYGHRKKKKKDDQPMILLNDVTIAPN